ncbi:MAG: exodeoxyribonuclease VII large subunit [Spirochaetes bacterium]|nr:exodeoxyribonuclease VII large subunit [Spirochaetota bacterium]MBU1080731.1 exodeoxyribonuclease VII large subunit [Spirochaetota bacterium]
MSEERALSISELTGIVKSLLEEALPDILVEGEISNWRPASSGHVYFTLKDSQSSLQAVMFRGRAARLPFAPADGTLVRARGALGVYAARGQYQLVVDSMQKAGQGDILALLEERKRALAAEGLFDADRKPPVPSFPTRVAVVTSPTGAALRDILSVLGRRNAGIRVTVLPAAVQGAEAPAAIVRQIEVANAFGLGDVIIVGRGGGSIEDLLAFSDDSVVRAVAGSRIPVISAVGHEIDWSLCDYAASLRAPTPSAAAELVSESAASVADRVYAASDTLALSMRARIERARLLAESFSSERLGLRLERALQPSRQRFDDALEALIGGAREACAEVGRRLASADALLRAADPMAVLARGFAVVRRHSGGEAVRDASELAPGEPVTITFASGAAVADIVEVKA